MSHPGAAPARLNVVSREQAAAAARQAESQVRHAQQAVQLAPSEAAVKSALRDAEKALSAARRESRDAQGRAALRKLERQVDQLRRDASRKQQDLASGEHHQRNQQARMAAALVDRLSPTRLGVVHTDHQLMHARVDRDPVELAFAGLRAVMPYLHFVDRTNAAPHIAREYWDPSADPFPTSGAIDPSHRVESVARTVNGDIAFLNQDGIPVAARFRLESQTENLRGSWMQNQMQSISLHGETGYDAGHMGPVSEGGVHAVEFSTPQRPSFNRGAQGGFETRIREVLKSNPGASIEVNLVIDRQRGSVSPKGYWFSSELVRADGSRTAVSEATGYWPQET
jgi:hypothetical protein